MELPGLFAGAGDARIRMRQIDWSKTPLGTPALWSQSLRLTVGICLNNRFPAAVWWGPEWTLIYNDAYAPILGKRHPDALGRSARAVWADVWPAITSQLEAVSRGEASWNERTLVPTDRNGVLEKAWFTWSFCPVRGDDGRIEGIFVIAVEETAHVLREQELTATRDRLASTLNAAEIGSWSLDAVSGRVIADANLARTFSVSTALAAEGVPLDVFATSMHEDDRARTQAAIKDALASRDTFEAEYRLAPQNGMVRSVIGRARVTRDENGRAIGMSGVLIDVTERMRTEQLVAAQNQVLKLVATETSLPRILEELVRHVETISPGTVASILLVDADGKLRHGAAPSLPDDFNRAVDGIQSGANVGTCGRAAFCREVVITPDLAADPNWTMLRERVAALGLRAAWSTPIISASGEILATFGTYFRETRTPDDDRKNRRGFSEQDGGDRDRASARPDGSTAGPGGAPGKRAALAQPAQRPAGGVLHPG